jgi:hypothetical protein
LANQQYPWHFTSEPNCFEGQVLVAPIHDYKQIEHPRGEYIYLACSRCGKTIERDLRTLKE